MRVACLRDFTTERGNGALDRPFFVTRCGCTNAFSVELKLVAAFRNIVERDFLFVERVAKDSDCGTVDRDSVGRIFTLGNELIVVDNQVTLRL